MGWTKEQVVLKAFGVTGFAQENMAVEDLLEGLSSLDAMIASWEPRGVRLGYLGSDSPTESDLAQPSGLPTWAIEAVYMNLGIRLAATNGREVAMEVKSIAQQSFDAVRIRCCKPPTMKLGPGIPAGGGNYRGWTGHVGDFLLEDEDDIAADGDSVLEFK